MARKGDTRGLALDRAAGEDLESGPDRSPARTVLPPSLRPRLALISVLAALVVGALGILFAGHSAPGAVDRWIFPPTSDSVGPPWRQVALVLDFLGEPAGSAMVIVACVVGCLLVRRPRAAVLVLVGAGATVGTTTLLKHVVGRTIHGPGNLSYPSGHTAFATALALMAALLATDRLGLGRTAGTSLVLTAGLVAGAIMGWAEVGLGAHYPTDALGGWCTALAVIPASAWLVDRTADRLGDRSAGRPGRRSPDRTADAGRRAPR
ncbi:phosphatase PAP2 family protein [Streptomyces sp. MBT53]|uniref:phosphatase PAP2 family protein n=1 Tax=Streptomyces sp. MBT53 TaxID=1488384 RepID=UPI001911B0C2|nr:phosphatase PAP2 family protein [Streptomyces sp. MBT53]MBK6012383.1 phosphatase PAP2 family protein [Streptomyces sp. MBT53]